MHYNYTWYCHVLTDAGLYQIGINTALVTPSQRRFLRNFRMSDGYTGITADSVYGGVPDMAVADEKHSICMVDPG